MNQLLENDDDEVDESNDSQPGAPASPVKNYLTPSGYARMKTELLRLLDTDRPEVVSIVSWAASNGDRSENGDYLYGKKRLREIDRRIRFLTKRLDIAEVVDASQNHGSDQVFFGATVSFLRNDSDDEETITIVGVDEVEPLERKVSWISPIAKALIKSREGDELTLRTPSGIDSLIVTRVTYPAPGLEPNDFLNVR